MYSIINLISIILLIIIDYHNNKNILIKTLSVQVYEIVNGKYKKMSVIIRRIILYY